MKVFIDTDPHGSEGIRQGEVMAMNHGITQRICLGDIWDANQARAIKTHFIRGNHEKDAFWAEERENVVLHPDYSTFLIGNVKFGVLGRMDPNIYAQLRTTLWLGHPDNATFTMRNDASQVLKECDVLLFHDSPYPFVANGHMAGSQYLTDIMDTVKPKLVFHGHMHQLQTRRWNGVEIVGLPPIDPTYVQQGYAVLDLEHLFVHIETWMNPYKHFGPGV